MVTLEGKIPGYVELDPGQTAQSPASWGGWDGRPCSGQVIVTWPGGRAEVAVDGPAQPTRGGPPTNQYTSWFRLVG